MRILLLCLFSFFSYAQNDSEMGLSVGEKPLDLDNPKRETRSNLSLSKLERLELLEKDVSKLFSELSKLKAEFQSNEVKQWQDLKSQYDQMGKEEIPSLKQKVKDSQQNIDQLMQQIQSLRDDVRRLEKKVN